MLNIKPGPGWVHLGDAVYEHPSETRIHVGGLVRLPDMSFVSLNGANNRRVLRVRVYLPGYVFSKKKH